MFHFFQIRKGLVSLSQVILGPNTLIQGALPKMLTETPQSFFENVMNVVQVSLRSNGSISNFKTFTSHILPSAAQRVRRLWVPRKGTRSDACNARRSHVHDVLCWIRALSVYRKRLGIRPEIGTRGVSICVAWKSKGIPMIIIYKKTHCHVHRNKQIRPVFMSKLGF